MKDSKKDSFAELNKGNGFNPEWIKALDLGCVVISLQIYVVPTPTEATFPVRSVYGIV